ncbi:MAG: hypothetical protein PVG65_01905 [Candidatus Thorarchaeota archaeon]|jgi:hypothetical protein
MTEDQLFEGLDLNVGLMQIEQLGKIVTKKQSQRFEQLVRKYVKSGVIDVTGWSIEAVRALLLVCREKGLTITFKTGERYSTPVKYPDGPLFEILVKSIMTGKW